MAPTFEGIEPHIEKIRSYIFGDLKRIANLEEGCNYAAVAIIMCACDLFARLRYGRNNYGAMFLTEYMGKTEIDARYSHIGKTLYEALRHGIVHTYETKKVQIRKDILDFVISWRQREHFSVNRSKWEINLNVPIMLEQLIQAFELYVDDLKRNGDLRDRFLMKLREGATMSAKDADEEKALLALFNASSRSDE